MLKELSNHNIPPPAFLFNKIKERLNDDEDAMFKKLFCKLAQHDTLPPESFDKRIDNFFFSAYELGHFKALKDHQVQPPVQFNRILLAAKNGQLFRSAKVVGLHILLKRIGAIAAVILIGIFVFSVYKKSAGPFKTQPEVVKIIPAVQPPDAEITPLDTAIIKPKRDVAKVRSSEAKSPIYKTMKKPDLVMQTPVAFVAEGQSFPIAGNDLLITFASFNETTAPAFLTGKEKTDTRITVDEYTSINISTKMAAFFKKLYKSKKNGKPTRRSKKLRLKLENWKKADEVYFNDSRNPLDPIELGWFILHK